MNIHHISLTVNNLKRSIPFYEHFGFKEKKRFGNSEKGVAAVMITNGTACLELWQIKDVSDSREVKEKVKRIGINHIAFFTSDIEKEKKRLEALGIVCSDIVLGMSERNYFFVYDPDGIPLEVYEDITQNE